jgi:hypothetical protein
MVKKEKAINIKKSIEEVKKLNLSKEQIRILKSDYFKGYIHGFKDAVMGIMGIIKKISSNEEK